MRLSEIEGVSELLALGLVGVMAQSCLFLSVEEGEARASRTPGTRNATRSLMSTLCAGRSLLVARLEREGLLVIPL